MALSLKYKRTIVETSVQQQYHSEDWKPHWLRCKKYIADAVSIENVGYNIDDVEENIANGSFQLWPGKESAVVTSIAEFPTKSFIFIIFSGGKMEELLKMLEEIEKFADFFGCSEIRLGGRKGWKRVLKNKGFKETNIISKKIGK